MLVKQVASWLAEQLRLQGFDHKFPCSHGSLALWLAVLQVSVVNFHFVAIKQAMTRGKKNHKQTKHRFQKLGHLLKGDFLHT